MVASLFLSFLSIIIGIHAMKTAARYQNRNQAAYYVIMSLGWLYFGAAALMLTAFTA